MRARELTGSEYGERRAQCEEGARRLGVEYLRDVSIEQFTPRERELPAVVGAAAGSSSRKATVSNASPAP